MRVGIIGASVIGAFHVRHGFMRRFDTGDIEQKEVVDSGESVKREKGRVRKVDDAPWRRRS